MERPHQADEINAPVGRVDDDHFVAMLAQLLALVGAQAEEVVEVRRTGFAHR